MITANSPRPHPPHWQQALRAAFSKPASLLEFLELDPQLPELALSRVADFPLRVPRGFAARMRKGDPNDPLLLQVWPRAAEDAAHPDFVRDPVGDLDKLGQGGVIHKYHGRALVVATGACGVHCRYCFRRHFPYTDATASRGRWQLTLQRIADDPSIEEVILSGGDPLSLSDDKLAEFAEALEFIPHVQRLRLHTRQPIVLPERIDQTFMDWISRGRLDKIIVLHANHANELDEAVAAALRPLTALGITLLNQSVLLAGINDSVPALTQLSKRLLACGIVPYYLHMLDRVAGSAHFEVAEDKAAALLRELHHCLPGYLVPRLAKEEPGQPAKTLLSW